MSSARSVLSASRRSLVGDGPYFRCRPSLSPERHQETRHAATKCSARSPTRVLQPPPLGYPPHSAGFFVTEHGFANRQGRMSDITAVPLLRIHPERRPTSRTNDAHPVACRTVGRATRNGCELSRANNMPCRSHRNPPSENPGARRDPRPSRVNTRLAPCRSHTTAPPAPPAHPSRKASLHAGATRSPRPAPTPGPFHPANTPPPLRGKRKRKKPLEALRAAQPLRPGARRPPAAPCNPLAVSATVNAPVPATVPGPPPFFRLRRLSELGIPIPAPAPSARRLPFATAPLVGAAPSRPQHPSHHITASRRSLSYPSYFPPARDAPLPAACRLLPLPAPPICARPPLPTSDLSRSPPVPHRPITRKRRPDNEPCEPSLRVRLRRTRSK